MDDSLDVNGGYGGEIMKAWKVIRTVLGREDTP